MDIKILGPGCAKCDKTYKIIKKEAEASSADATIEKVTDMMQIAGYGVFGTPAVVIDGEVKSVGKVPSAKDVKTWLGSV